MTVVLGINAYHGDSSAAIVVDGRLVAAAEEERFRRMKHWAGFPTAAIRYCLAQAGCTLADVQHAALNSDPRANLWRKLAYALVRRPELRVVIDRARAAGRKAGFDDILAAELAQDRFEGRVHHVEHHLAHLASAHLVGPFDSSVAVSVDGFGDFASAAWGLGEGSRLAVQGRVLFPHSLGIFYQALTQYLGFPHYGDEYKVMGLAPYGEPRYVNTLRRVVRLEDDGTFRLKLGYFRHHRERFDYRWDGGAPLVGDLFSPVLEALLGPRRRPDEPLEDRHRDLARSVQAVYEEAFFHLLERLHGRYGVDALTLAGGCAMNSVANGKVCRRTPFRHLYVQAAGGDAGGAVGAAFVVWHRLARGSERFLMDHAYWGPQADEGEVASLLTDQREALVARGCSVARVADEAQLCELTARAVADGKVVGWFQGRMEWGPRALGNRSIVCDPRRPNMKDILNRKVKRRESFRPFAPSVLREAVSDWFEQDDDVPFMMKVFVIRPEKRSDIPAVTHVDGTGRLQTVVQETNPRYYRLIESFRDMTGIPMVLNTSFNENEPVVCRPQEALDCFLRTQMDVLVMGDYVITRAPE